MDGMELAALILTSGVVGGVSVEFVRAIFNRRSNQADVRLKRATATGEIADAAQTMVGISVDRAERLEEDNLELRDKVNRLVERVKDAEAFKVVLETQMLESNKMRISLEEAATKQAYEINRLKERVHRHSEHIVDLQDEKTELKGKIETLEAQVNGVS